MGLSTPTLSRIPKRTLMLDFGNKRQYNVYVKLVKYKGEIYDN